MNIDVADSKINIVEQVYSGLLTESKYSQIH